MRGAISSNYREVITGLSTASSNAEYLTSTSGKLNVNASIAGTVTVSGSVTANAGTNLNTSLLALESGGNLATIVTNTTGLATSANQTNGTQQVKLTDGTNIASVLKADGTAAAQNAQMIAGTGFTTATVTLNLGSPASQWYDLLNYPWLSTEVLTNSSAATLTWQTSGDASQTNISSMGLGLASNTVNSMSNTTTSAVGNFYGPRTGRYFRVFSNVSGANTITLVLTFYTAVSYPTTTGVQAGQSGAPWSMVGNKTNNNATPGATNVGALVGVANAAAPTYTETDQVLLSTDLLGNLRTLINGGLMPTNTALNPYSVHLTTNTTTTPTSSTAYISTIAISTEVVGTTSTVTIQDKSGTPLKLVPTLTTVAVGLTIYNFQTPVKMVSGIDIITAGVAAATIDVWIDYYQ